LATEKSLLCAPPVSKPSVPACTSTVALLLKFTSVELGTKLTVPLPCLVKVAPGLLLNWEGVPPSPQACKRLELLAVKMPLLSTRPPLKRHSPPVQLALPLSCKRRCRDFVDELLKFNTLFAPMIVVPLPLITAPVQLRVLLMFTVAVPLRAPSDIVPPAKAVGVLKFTVPRPMFNVAPTAKLAVPLKVLVPPS